MQTTIKSRQRSGQGQRLILIGGSPRSGTTLVQNMLDCHPDVYGGPEFDRIPMIVEIRNRLVSSVATGRIDTFCSREDVNEAAASMIERLLLPVADKNGCKYLSEKTPSNVLVFKELLEVLPRARFIHVVRDPRAIVASLLMVGLRAKRRGVQPIPITTNVQSAIHAIKEGTQIGFAAAAHAPDRVHTIVYEKIVTNPEGESRALCTFLGIPWAEEMLRPGEKTHSGEKVLDEVWYDRRTYYRNPVTTEIDKWKKILTPEQQAIIASAFRDEENHAKLGYSFS